MSVYVLSHFGDVHAHAVQWACETLGERTTFLNLFEVFEGNRIGLIPEEGRQRIVVNGETLDPASKIWLRRPNSPKLLSESSVHPSDLKFAQLCCSSLYRGFLESLSGCDLVVSSWSAHSSASLKMNQLSAAQAVGMNTPRTVFTNDLDLAFSEIRDGWIAKSHNQFKWADPDGLLAMMPSVTSISKSQLERYSKSFPYSPIILQQKVKSVDEVRVFAFGRTIFAASLGFSNLNGEMDWRRFHKNLDIRLIELPGDLREKIFKFMEMLDLRSGAFDFIVDEAGEFIFLEVNSCGQWLWMEVNDSFPLLDAFARFLISGDTHYEYQAGHQNVIRYEDFLQSECAESVFAQTESPGPSSPIAKTIEGKWFSSSVEFEMGEKQ